jgi:signal transduction histidine kinase
LGLSDRLGASVIRTLGRAQGNVRIIVIGSLLLIFGCFASAALIEMHLDRARALSAAAEHQEQRAKDLAGALDDALDRYASIGEAFAATSLDAESAAALAEVGGAPLKNAVVLDHQGRLISELKAAPRGILPLSPQILAQAQTGHALLSADDGHTLIVALPANGRIAALEVDPSRLIAQRADALIALPSGRILAAGKAWGSLPDLHDAALEGSEESRTVELSDGSRILALTRVPGWPIVAGTSVATGDALLSWRGVLPLYLFIIFGPALAGAGLAAVFVHEFEQRMRSARAARTLRATRPEEARLLVRLADVERRAVLAERAKAEFMAHMSHELGTPLNAIIGFAEAMEVGALGPLGNPKHAEYAHDIASAGRQLHTRIRDILEFADMDARRRPLTRGNIDVSQVAREALESIRVVAKDRGIAVLVSLPHDAHALADAHALKQILMRVLANGVQFTPKGGEIRFSVRSTANTVIAQLCDTGMGFSEEEKARAGEAFHRFDRPGHNTGLGLGLTTATTLARRMGGSLHINSQQGQGTTVEVRLPRSDPKSPDTRS